VDFGHKTNITIQDVNPSGVNSTVLQANDPMYLMSSNNLVGYENEATNELIDRFPVPVEYENEKGEVCKSQYEMVLSIAKPEIQKLSGSHKVGVHYGKNSGITFVRAGREIGFGNYGYTSSSEPRDRWWGMEVRFGPELDELFGVPINKQSVDHVEKISDDFTEGLLEEELDLHDKFRKQLSHLISGHIRDLMKTISSRGEGALSKSGKKDEVKVLVNQELVKQTSTKTSSKAHAESLNEDEKIAEIISAILDDDSSLTADEAGVIAEEVKNYEVDILTNEWEGFGFLGLKFCYWSN